MCGILGIVGAEIPPDLPLHTLRHRGPDAANSWTNSRSCILGSTRLAIVDLDARANQPMRDPSGRFVIVFNGEIYNHEELRKRSLSDDRLTTTSDTEVLLHLWARLGVDCLPLLRGMFAFAIWDEHSETLFLVRDRIGKKPLFYSLEHQRIAFASELGGLVPLLRKPPDVDPTSIDLFLAHQFVPCPRSIYRGISKLPPAHYGVWRQGMWTTQRYWELRFSSSGEKDEGEALEQLDDAVREATRIRLRADVPVGVLLSGGVDSGLIAAFAAEEYGRPIQTFSVGFQESAFDELHHANAVATRYGTDHHPLVMSEGVDELFLEAVRRYGEPFGDKSALPSLLVCREAARYVKVVLNGDGGDELFAGYPKYQVCAAQRLLGRYAKPAASLGGVLDALARDLGGAQRLLRRARGVVSPLSRVTHFDGFVRAEDQRKLYWPDMFDSVRLARKCYEQALLSELRLPPRLLDTMLHVDYRHYLANDLLVKMDIASMSSSLEARSPLLDHTLFELAATWPANLKIRRRTGKYLLKRLAERYLPLSVIHRPKQGFSIPVSQWIRDRFRHRLEALCASTNEPIWAYCRPSMVRLWLREHLTRQRDHGFRLWAILVLGTWLGEEKSRLEHPVRHSGVPTEASRSRGAG